MGPRLLLLNLDAEDELAARRRGARYAPSSRALAAVRRAATALAPFLPADVRPWLPGEPAPAAAREAFAWCPTPAAAASLAALGSSAPAPAEPALPSDVLAAANDRANFHDLDPLPGGAVAADLRALARHIAATPSGTTLRLRRGLAAAGRGARLVAGGAPLTAGDLAWARAALARGAVTADPRVDVVRELSLHGRLGAGGDHARGAACVQEVDAHGQWLRTRRAAPDELGGATVAVLERALERAAARLTALGYLGPFNVDAFEWRDAAGAVRLCAPSEVNARYSMGWWVGMGEARAES